MRLPRFVQLSLIEPIPNLQRWTARKEESAEEMPYQSKYIQVYIYIQIISWEKCNYNSLWRLYTCKASLGARKALHTLLSWLHYHFLGA